MPQYDLVFAKGRCALEALACGAATVICDVKGAGPIVKTSNFERLRKDNFGRRILTQPMNAEYISQQIQQYDASNALEVTNTVRSECGVDKLCHQIENVYETVLNERYSIQGEEVLKAAYQGVKWW